MKRKRKDKTDYFFKDTLIKAVKNYPCLYNPADEGYGIAGLQEESWRLVSIQCERPIIDCKHMFQELFDKYGEVYMSRRSCRLGRKERFRFFKPMHFMTRFIPFNQVKRRLLAKSKYTPAEKLLIVNYVHDPNLVPDLEELRVKPATVPEAGHDPIYQTNCATISQPTPSRPVQQYQPTRPQPERTNLSPNRQTSREHERSASGTNATESEVQRYFASLSQQIIKSAISQEEFIEIQTTILKILAEKLPQYNS